MQEREAVFKGIVANLEQNTAILWVYLFPTERFETNVLITNPDFTIRKKRNACVSACASNG